MRVLIVEDDRALGAFLKSGLEAGGQQVEWVEDGEAALTRVRAQHPELVLLDLSLPKLDGMEIMAQIRARHDDASMLVLTGCSDPHVKVEYLNMGADDCMLKPFSFDELIARCRVLMRRRERFSNPVLRHGDLALHRIEHTVARAGGAEDNADGEGIYAAGVSDAASWRVRLARAIAGRGVACGGGLEHKHRGRVHQLPAAQAGRRRYSRCQRGRDRDGARTGIQAGRRECEPLTLEPVRLSAVFEAIYAKRLR